MEEGFAFLENSEFDKAETFFNSILRSYPNNITANICYGRAIGLKGEKEQALRHFEKLHEKEPDHYEIGLNLAEAMMWSEHYVNAAELYKTLYFKDPSNFVVNQGRANVFAALKKNHEALYFIKQALHIQPGNKGARLSEKYIRLALYDEYRKEWRYDQASAQLDSIETYYMSDREVLLSRANIALSKALPTEAESYYDRLIKDNIDTYEGLQGKAYTLTLRNKNDDALTYARMAYAHAQEYEGELNRLRSTIGLVNALGVNRKYKEASRVISETRLKYPLEEQFNLAAARISAWSGEYKRSAEIYSTILPDSLIGFEYHMGLAELYRATKENDKSKGEIRKALEYLPNQPDAIRLINEIRGEDQMSFHVQHSISKDNGNNEAQISSVRLDFGAIQKLRPFVYMLKRKANSMDHVATQDMAAAGFGYRWSHRIEWDVSGSLIRNSSSSDAQGLGSTYGLLQKMKFGKVHNLDIGLTKQFHNYSSDLIESGLSMVNYQLNYNFHQHNYPGLFVQYLYTTQSDENTRRSTFASLYYRLLELPSLKLGINYLSVSYDRSQDALYFSPDRFSNYEVFGELSTEHVKRKTIFCRLFMAVGQQRISDTTAQSTFRGEMSFGYRLTQSITAIGKYSYSTSAQSTAAGFTHQLANLNVIYVLPFSSEL